MADGGTTATDVRSRRWLPLVLKLSGLALVVAVTVAVTLLAVDRRRQADERDGVRWCQQQVIAQALRDQKATASAEIQFAGEQFVVGQNDAGRRAIEVDGAVAIAGVESRYSCGRDYGGGTRFGYLTVHWADDEGTR